MTIKEPIDFNKEKAVRDEVVVKRLEKIRDSQLVFKQLHGKYANSFDTLITVLNNDSIEITKTIGDPNDSTIQVKIEKFKKAIKDSLFKGDDRNIMDDLAVVPGVDGEQFYMMADTIRKNNVLVYAFESGVPYKNLYKGMIPKYFDNLKDDTLRVGNIKEGTTAGNWKKQ